MKQNATINQIFKRLKPYIAMIVLSLIFAGASVVMSLYIPILVGDAIDLIVGKGDVDFDGIFKIFVSIAILAGCAAIAQWLMSAINNRVTYHVVRDIRADAIRKIQKTPLYCLDPRPVGDTVSRVIADVDTFADGLLLGFTQLFTGVVTIICTLAFMLGVNPMLTIPVVVLTPLTLLTARFIAKRTYAMFKKQAELRGEQTAFIDETVTNQKTVKAFGREEAVKNSFDDINARLCDASTRATFFSSLTNPTTRFINSVIYAVVALTGAIIAVSGDIGVGLTVGGLSAFLSYASQYAKPFNEISGVITELQNALACAKRVFELTEETPSETEPENAKELKTANGRVELDDVKFSYNKETKLIENLNLSVEPGSRVAIVGPTGCGKTTLINLLMRFYDVDSGAVRIDGEDIRNVTRHSLRANYGMVLQDTWIKEDTVRNNIAFGNPNAADEEIISAAAAAHADGFINRLPNGYDTVISDESGLSQGQKQLICIARVMLCLPPMLILDEATSSIDTRTELMIQDDFGKMMRGRTSFIVAHRLSTVRDADTILVMKNGSVIEQGNHDSLLKKGGFYATLYNSQF